MIITHQVQHAMEHEDAELIGKRALEPAGVLACDPRSDGNITQIGGGGSWAGKGRGGRALSPGWPRGKTHAPLRLPAPLLGVRGERKNVRSPRFLAEGAIPARHLRVGYETDRDGTGRNAQSPLHPSKKTFQAGHGDSDRALAIQNHRFATGESASSHAKTVPPLVPAWARAGKAIPPEPQHPREAPRRAFRWPAASSARRTP